MIPLATTEISATRATGGDGQPPTTQVFDGVRAHIGSPTVRVDPSYGFRVVTTWKLLADPCDLKAGDAICDTAGNRYLVLAATPRKGLGLDHMTAVLTDVEGGH